MERTASMRCPHCTTEFHFEEYESWVFEYDEAQAEGVTGYEITHTFCPACSELIVVMRDGEYHCQKAGDSDYVQRAWLTEQRNEELLYPKASARPIEKEVPEVYAKDYKEAAAVRGLSPKASAAISRRLLQLLLRDACGVKKASLAQEVKEFVEKPGIPSYLAEAVDAVRNVGNFAAHPLKSTNTGEVIEVEDGEADWLLDVLDAMFDYLFVQPKRLKDRRDSLNAKLKDIGKPPMK